MLHRRARVALAALTALGIPLSPVTAMSAEASTHTMRTTQILLNGHLFSQPKAFTYANTTYMPLYYVENVLKAVGIQNTWNGSRSPQVWTLQTKTPVNVSLNLVAKTGTVNIVIDGKTVCKNVTKLVDTDPYSKSPTTFVPIWYIQQVLKAVGLTNTWENGTVWNIKTSGAFNAYSKGGDFLGGFSTLQDAENALVQYPGGTVVDQTGNVVFTEPDFVNVDLRYSAPSNVTASSIDRFFQDHGSPLTGLGSAFMDAQNTYGVDANYLVSHAINESNWGKSPIAVGKSNLFGYGAFDASAASSAGMFPSETYAVRFQAWVVRNNYLEPGSIYYVSPTLAGMAKNYASDSNWATAIGKVMDQFAIYLGDTVQSYPQFSTAPSTPVPAPSSTAEPVYYLNGAAGVAAQTPFYGGLPVYPDMATGVKDMFTRVLQSGDKGNDVTTLQTALNQQLGTSLGTDGIFGPQTQTALQQYQSTHGLSVTGTCDFNTWTSLQIGAGIPQIPAGTTLPIDQMKLGMSGGDVSDWFHVTGQGWVNGADVSLQNVYRLTVTDPTSPAQVAVPVYNPANPSSVIATLRAGDFVTASGNTSGTSIQISFADETTGQLRTGIVKTATLTKVASTAQP